MKIIKSNILENHEDIEYLYVFHDLASHKKGTDGKYAISKTYYFQKEEQFYNQQEMLQDDLEAIGIKDESTALGHIGKLNKEQLEFAKAKRSELKSIKKSASSSNKNSELIEFHDEIIGLLLEWFNKHNNYIEEDSSDKEKSNDALWAIADDMRARKEEGEFETYREAYRWAEKNISKKGLNITAHRLERAYHKAKSEGKVGEEKASKVSIPLMITTKMRMDLLTLGWSKDEMKHLTPKQCWEIIDKGVPKKPSRERGRNQ